MTPEQKLMQTQLAYFLVDHYRLSPLDRQMQLLRMRRIVGDAELRAEPVDESIDHYLDDPRRGQAAEINGRRG